MADIEQLNKIVPLITCEICFGQNVCELVFGVNVTNLDLGVQINPVKQPIQSNSVGPCPLNCLALSSFGFSIAHCCFAFFFAASHINFYMSAHTSSGREVVCFLVSLTPDHVYPSGGLFVQ